ncbi:MAG TPA: PTS sugar transporter subunit IIA [bacterium]
MQLGVNEAAKLLQVSEKTIYSWIQKRQLPNYRVNDQYHFNRVELLEWATANGVTVSADIFHEPETEIASSAVSLSEALANGGIYYHIAGDNKKSVLQAIVETMRLPEEVDREFLLHVMWAREELGSTGIGDGIAIPHVRNPIVLHVSQPSISLCFLDKPIEFQALDGRPVSILFTLLSPSVRAHLQLLAKLSYALRSERLLALLKKPGSREEILGEIRRIEHSLPSQEDKEARSDER